MPDLPSGGRLDVFLEREDELAALAEAAGAAVAGTGSVVLVCGEAGIGKSSLIGVAGAALPPRCRFLVGYCDDLATPRVLGPLRDLIGRVGPVLAEALRRGDQSLVMEAVGDELSSRPTCLVIEDVHWADEATLDVLRYLVRRVPSMPLVLVLTYRDDELGSDQPLRQLLGLVSRTGRMRRLRLARLTPAAVRRMSADTGVNADQAFGVTSGNPYFVVEVLAAGDAEAVPLTIADAVQARMARLDPDVRSDVEQLAVVTSAVTTSLVDALIVGGGSVLAPAEQVGLLTVLPQRVTFRHELTRRAVVDAMPASRRISANRRVLAALRTSAHADVSRIVHHAVQAGDDSAVLTYGRLAAEEALAAGAHRQSAAHLGLVLNRPHEFDRGTEARLWHSYGVELYTIDAPWEQARSALERAVALRRDGDPRLLADTLRWLSRICWWAGDAQSAAAAGDEAVGILSSCGGDELAMALSNQAQLHALAGRQAQAIVAAQRAIQIGGHLPITKSHALNNLGLALSLTDYPQAERLYRESLELALDADDPEHACRSYVNLIWSGLEHLDLAAARRWLAAGLELADRRECVTFARYLKLELGMLKLATGDWDEIAETAAFALDGTPPFRCSALTLIGRLRARRGEEGAIGQLRESWRLAQSIGECQRIGPAAAALAEATDLSGEPGLAHAELATAYGVAREFGTEAVLAEIGFWLIRAGGVPEPSASGHPYAELARGNWRRAAEVWDAAGFPYEAAFARTSSESPDDLLAALSALDALGAEPLATRVRAQLRRLGVSRIPRGRRDSTRVNPAGLTERQLQVCRLLSEGMTNAEIAAQLVLSVRTVDSHLAAILAKFGVRTRREAADVLKSLESANTHTSEAR